MAYEGFQKEAAVEEPGLTEAQTAFDEARNAVNSTREKMTYLIEQYERRAENLRDQATIYAQAARELRKFVYGSDVETKVDNTDYSNDHVPAGIT
jgi:multidrug efflux pump subunit AcrA (membrane-fusion protein)